MSPAELDDLMNWISQNVQEISFGHIEVKLTIHANELRFLTKTTEITEKCKGADVDY